MKTTKAFDWTLRTRVHHTFVCTRTQQLNSRSPYRGRVWHPAPCSEAAAAWYRGNASACFSLCRHNEPT